MSPQKLGAFAMGAAMRRAGLDPEEVEILGGSCPLVPMVMPGCL